MSSQPNCYHHIKRIAQDFFSFFRRVSVPSEQVDSYRYHQFCTIARLLPLVSIATYFAVCFGLFFAWNQGHHGLLIIWSTTLSIIASSELVIWWVYIIRRTVQHVTKFIVYILALGIALAGILYAVLVLHLFSIFSDHERIFLFAITSAFISSGGWIFASIPLVGLLWTICLSVSLASGMLLLFGNSYLLMAVLVIIYCVFLCCVIVIFSRQYLKGLIAETEIEKQHQTVSLLLHDFEEKASDWLWETNKKGHLRHLSQKLIDATNASAESLLKLPYIRIIENLLAKKEKNSKAQLQTLSQALASNDNFSDIVVPVTIDDDTRWWSFSAKILLDKKQQYNGWRGVASDITSIVLREREMIKQANTDTLTGIGNRLFFNQQLAILFPKTDEQNAPCTLLLLDLDNFKMINDSFGHAAGDELLIEASKRLSENTPEDAILARLGGDEFALIVPHTTEYTATALLSRQLQSAIAQPWYYGENHIEIHASIGIAFTSQDITSIDTLLRASDLALYAAKEVGSDTVRFFEPAMEEAANNKGQILSEMRQSILNNEFVLHYQPQLNLITGEFIGFEALVRWKHPKRGMIPPLEFIPIAEESGLILALGSWILEQACLEATKWPSDTYVAVNVSAIQIERSDFLAEIQEVLNRTQLPHHRLEIEITESVLMKDKTPAFNFLMGLKNIGVNIALDDFGTGFSSLSYLQNLPLDKIKIDRSFIDLSDSDEKACAIIRTITQLADALQLNTIAEGIERTGQYKLLSDLGVNSGQGYLYARPMPAAEILSFIETKKQH